MLERNKWVLKKIKKILIQMQNIIINEMLY